MKCANAFQRDQKKMQRQGWTIQNTMDHHQARSVVYKLIVPFGMLSSGKNQIIVYCFAFVEGLRWGGRVNKGVKPHAKRPSSVRESV